MTKTFNDIEAVNRLLEEKERDLELAARIGQTLLEKNKQLCEKNAELDESLGQACDKVQQLRHDISMKDELLRFYCQDLENAETESSDGSPSKSFNLSSADLDALQKRVLSLEEDNLGLRLETVQLKSNTDNMEEKEQKLVADCVIQLNVCNEQLEALSDELIKKAEENTRQKEEITALLAQIVDLQKKSKTQTIENMELSKHLEAAQYSQRSLTRELTELHDRYDELFELLEEAQDELKLLRSRDKPRAVRSHYMSTPYLPTDSLASELQASLKDELDFQKGASALEKRMQNWKVFETAKAAKRAVQRRATSRSSLQLPSSNVNRSGGDSVGESGNSSVRSSFYMSDNESAISDGYNADMDSLQGSDIGRPGVPGSNDLETALRKLAMRRANELNEKDFFEDQLKRDRSSSTESCNMRLESDGASCLTPPMPSWTPDSLMSVGSLSGLSGLSMSTTSTGYRLPEKLQIVKPIEGSVTLRRWQMLATPHMGGIFEERPGVVTKGQEKMEEETYNLSDLEEDDEHASCPSKRFEDSGSVYTYTNSVAARHGENLETTPSLSSRMSSIPGSSKPNFPRKIDNKQGQFTMSLGLAAILNEREHNSAPDQGIGLRINTAVTKTAAGKQPEMTDSNYESMTTSATNSSILLQDPPMRKQTQREAAKTPPQRLGMKEGESARSFIERLKSKSRSLYSIWNSSSGPQEKVTDLNVSSSVDGPTMTNSVSDSAVSSAVSGTTVTAKSTSTEKKNSDPLKGSPSMGVLGALTNFRTSGLL